MITNDKAKAVALLREDISKTMSDRKTTTRNSLSLFVMATDKKAQKATTANREKNTPMKKKSLRPFGQVLQRSCRYMT